VCPTSRGRALHSNACLADGPPPSASFASEVCESAQVTTEDQTQSVRRRSVRNRHLQPGGRALGFGIGWTMLLTYRHRRRPNHRSGHLVVPDNISLLFLPVSSPELNPKKNSWDEIREKVFKNYALKSIEHLRHKLHEAILYVEHNPELVKSITSFPYIANSLIRRWYKLVGSVTRIEAPPRAAPPPGAGLATNDSAVRCRLSTVHWRCRERRRSVCRYHRSLGAPLGAGTARVHPSSSGPSRRQAHQH